ncbi:MAG TPA: isoamylase early set domain-containing protein [Sporichthyaceae bacterium]|jgi:1,4-alpha-glucan branching enzyme
MFSCDIKPDERRVLVTFTVSDPGRTGQEVYVVGDFNDWDPCATPMLNDAGRHTVTVALWPGRRYRYRYLSSHDGWFNDSDGWHEYNEFGQQNCVVDLAIIDVDGLRRRLAG